MHVRLIRDLPQLLTVEDAWRALAAHPLMSPDWLLTWWEYYGSRDNTELCVPTILDEQHQLIGLAPWYLQRHPVLGNTIRALGDGAACTDHLGLICRTGRMRDVTKAIAMWLSSDTVAATARLLHLDHVDVDDAAVELLAHRCHEQGAWIERRPAVSTWQVELPTTWDEYLACLSKNHRKRCRRWGRQYFESGQVQLHTAESPADLAEGMALLRQLHSSRRQQLGDSGAFGCETFYAFHSSVMSKMLKAKSLRLAWLSAGNRPIAIEYQFVSDDAVWAYQSGMDPGFADISPGNLSVMASIRWAIEHGKRHFDFMRGDEPYKASWGAAPNPTHHVRIRPDLVGNGVRHGVSRVGYRTRSWLKSRFRG